MLNCAPPPITARVPLPAATAKALQQADATVEELGSQPLASRSATKPLCAFVSHVQNAKTPLKKIRLLDGLLEAAQLRDVALRKCYAVETVKITRDQASKWVDAIAVWQDIGWNDASPAPVNISHLLEFHRIPPSQRREVWRKAFAGGGALRVPDLRAFTTQWLATSASIQEPLPAAPAAGPVTMRDITAPLTQALRIAREQLSDLPLPLPLPPMNPQPLTTAPLPSSFQHEVYPLENPAGLAQEDPGAVVAALPLVKARKDRDLLFLSLLRGHYDAACQECSDSVGRGALVEAQRGCAFRQALRTLIAHFA